MKKYNNKILIVILVVLVAGFVLSRLFRAPDREGNLRKQLIEIDSAKITKIEIMRPKKSEAIVLLQQQGEWKVKEGDKEVNADNKAVGELLKISKKIEIRNLVSRKKEKWNTFEVSDSSAIKVRFYVGADKKADLRIGKIGFGKRQRGDIHTYVRLADEDEVYTTDGYLNFHLNKQFNDWRDKGLVTLNKDDIEKIVFNYPDSGFVLQKKDSLWRIGTQTVNQEEATAYLSKLELHTMTVFDDTFTPPASASPLVIRVEGEDSTQTTLKAWPVDEGWTINSSAQANVYFADKQGQTVKDLFVGISTFIKPRMGG